MEKNRILIFAGAGISAESGLSTFRDSDGLWTKYDVNEVCNITAFKEAKDTPLRRAHIFEFYNLVKESILAAKPNAAHLQVAAWQKRYGKDRVKIVTANIDNLFEKAGCEEVVHVHGEIFNMHCTACAHTWYIGEDRYDHIPRCPKCNSRLTKPNIVFFGEMAPEYFSMNQIFNVKNRHRDDVLLYVGSSMSVIPPSKLNISKINMSVVANKEVQDEQYEKKVFKERYYGNATESLPLIDTNIVFPTMLS